LREPERLYHIYNKEMLAIMNVLVKFRQYLVGGRFVERTNHNNMRYFLKQRNLSERQHKWVSKVQAYDFNMKYVKGTNNVVVDALSKRPANFSMTNISVDWKSILLVEYSKNTFACDLMEGIIQNDMYKVVDDIIYYKEKIYLVPESTLEDHILRVVHDAPLAGHPRYLKDLQEGEREILLEGSQGGCTVICEGVHDMSTEQVEAYTSCNITSVVTYSRGEVGEHLHGLHHRVVEGTGQGLYLCGGG
jgi:hypothetical protein